ncbi:transcriptional regulator [Salimicrobium humidisoli]|uniref:Transcriptional regulator n=1 Tax=Salimicrobium humidisoli TaxID=2029857 RepID=A0ABX4HTB6_9BACI|nr:transcriptional regulator [Salimicrobium humidisoli]
MRLLRIERKISQEMLVLVVGITRSYIYIGKIERGEVNGSILLFYQIGETLDAKPESPVRDTGRIGS